MEFEQAAAVGGDVDIDLPTMDVDLGQLTDLTEVVMRNSDRPNVKLTSFIAIADGSIVPEEAAQSMEMDGVNADNETHTDGRRPSSTSNVFNDSPYTELMNMNQYNTRKMASQALIDVALMMANISQLRTLFGLGEEWVQFYKLMVSLVCISLICQVIFAIFMFTLWMREADLHQKQDMSAKIEEMEQNLGATMRDSKKLTAMRKKQDELFKYNRLTSRINYISMFLVFIITVINMFITGFSIKIRDKPGSS